MSYFPIGTLLTQAVDGPDGRYKLFLERTPDQLFRILVRPPGSSMDFIMSEEQGISLALHALAAIATGIPVYGQNWTLYPNLNSIVVLRSYPIPDAYYAAMNR